MGLNVRQPTPVMTFVLLDNVNLDSPRIHSYPFVPPRLWRWRWLVPLAMAALICSSCTALSGDRPARASVWRSAGLQGLIVHSVLSESGSLYAGTEKGVFQKLGKHRWKVILRGADIWDVAGSANELVAADNAGSIDVSNDGGRHWRKRFLTRGGLYAVTVSPTNARWMLAGAAGGIFLSRDGGRHWTKTARLGENAIDAFTWEKNPAETVMAGNVAGGGKAAPDTLVSHDAGLSWRPGVKGLPAAGVMSLLSLRDGQVLAGSMGRGVWRFSPGHIQWIRELRGMPKRDDHGSALVMSPGRALTVYVGTQGFGIFKSTNGGRTWHGYSGGLSQSDNSNLVLSLAYSSRLHELLAGTANGVFASELT